mgnify:CR=1 FL=1
MNQTQSNLKSKEASVKQIVFYSTFQKETGWYAITDSEGTPICYDHCEGCEQSYNHGFFLSVQHAIDLAANLQADLWHEKLQFVIKTDAQWLTGKNNKTKGKQLRDYAGGRNINLELEWIKARDNPAKQYTYMKLPYFICCDEFYWTIGLGGRWWYHIMPTHPLDPSAPFKMK